MNNGLQQEQLGSQQIQQHHLMLQTQKFQENLDLEVLRGLLQLTMHLIWILVRMKFQPHKLLTMQVQTQKHFLNRLEHLYKCTIFVVWVLGMELH